MLLLNFTSVRFCRHHWIHSSFHEEEQLWHKTRKCTCFGEMSCDECKVTDDERASRLPLAESKVDASDVEWVPPPNPRFEVAPIPFGGGAAIPYAMPISFDVPAATPVPPVVASPFATPPSSSISSSPKPGLVQMKINFTPIMKHKTDSLYTLGHSSDDEDYAVPDSQD